MNTNTFAIRAASNVVAAKKSVRDSMTGGDENFADQLYPTDGAVFALFFTPAERKAAVKYQEKNDASFKDSFFEALNKKPDATTKKWYKVVEKAEGKINSRATWTDIVDCVEGND
jgi:hypothetical protein